MRKVGLPLLGLAIALLCACGAQAENRNPDVFCQATLEFPNDTERVAFIDRNLESVTRHTPALMLASHPTLSKIYLVSERDECPESLDSALGLTGVDAATTAQASMRMVALSALFASEASAESWTQDTPRQCVIRGTQNQSDAMTFMAGVMYAGLRDSFVHGDGETVYFSANESCAITERAARASMALPQSGVSEIGVCANSSHRACGDPSAFEVGPVVGDVLEHMNQTGRDRE